MAVDGDCLASHHLGGRRGEEEAHIGDLFRLHKALDRLGLDIFLVDEIERDAAALGLGLCHVLHARAIDRARANCIGAHVVGAELDGEGFGKADHSPFRGGIRRAQAIAVKAGGRGDVDDAARALALHDGRGAPGAEELCIETDAQTIAPVFELELLDIAGRSLGAGIVDQDIETLEIADSIVEPTVDRFLSVRSTLSRGDLRIILCDLSNARSSTSQI